MKEVDYFDCNLSDLSIDMKEVYLLMGYGNHIPNRNITTLIDDMICELKSFCRPRCGYVHINGEIIDSNQIKIGNTILLPGKIITSAMKNAQSFAVFTATAGSSFDEWNKRLKDEDIVKAFIADALGSVIVEAAVLLLTKQLEAEAAKLNLPVTNNYSPGYCDWQLTEQKKLFSLLPENISGIELTGSCLMLPIKSVSGIVGIGKNVKKKAYRCDICKMTNCIKNKKNA